MNRPSQRPRNSRLAVLLTVFMVIIPGSIFITPTVVAAASAPATSAAPAKNGNATHVAVLAHGEVFAGWMDKAYGTMESALSNRTRVLQIGMIAMLLALWIIWWRK